MAWVHPTSRLRLPDYARWDSAQRGLTRLGTNTPYGVRNLWWDSSIGQYAFSRISGTL